MNHLKNLDIISKKIKIHHEDMSRIPTIYGIIISIIVFGLSISCFILFSLDIINRRNPNVVTNLHYNPSPSLNISDNYLFAWNLQLIYGVQIPNLNKNFKFMITYLISNSSNTENPVVKITIPTISCDKSKRYLKFNQSFNLDSMLYNPIQNYICLPDDIPPYLINTYGMPYFQYYQLDVIANNLTSIDLKGINQIFIHSLSSNYYFDGNNYTNPEQVLIDSQLTSSSLNFFKRIKYLYQNVDYKTDDGIVFSNANNIKSYQISNFNTDTNVIQSDNVLFRIQLTLNTIEIITNRTYTKIQNVLANVGGIFNSILFFAQIIMKLFEFSAYENLINSFSKNDELNKKIRNDYKNIIREEKDQKILASKNNFLQSTITDEIRKQGIQNMDHSLVQKKKLSSFEGENTLIDGVISKEKDTFFMKIFRKSKNIKKIQAWYRNLMSVESLFQVQEDVEKLKNIFFDENQISLFSLIKSKKTCKVNQNNLEKSILDSSKYENNDELTKKMLKIFLEK